MNFIKLFVLLVAQVLIFTNVSISQKTQLNQNQLQILGSKFSNFQLLDIDFRKKDILNNQRNGNISYSLSLTDGSIIKLDLVVTDIISENYVLRVKGQDGVNIEESSRPIPTNGYINGNLNSRASITFNDGFIYGFIRDNNDLFYIEPVSGVLNNPGLKNKFIFYNVNDIIEDNIKRTCGAEAEHDKYEEIKSQVNNNRVDQCYEVEWAIASDYLMFQNQGSISGVENHNIGVANDVQTNYDDEFADELFFEITEQYVVNCNGCDPWTNSTDAVTLLNDFTNWGPTGFFASHDIGSLWTDRNFDGSTVGIAWLSVVCTSLRYNCLQNFTNNANFKRVMVAHEIGHNFSAQHDSPGSNTIMAPSVNNTTTWSSASINSIENHYLSRWCLDDCGSTAPPFSEFTIDILEDCIPGLVQMNNNSTGATSYLWEFEGGTPLTSTDENPTVTYLNAGTFDITLTAYNSVGQDEYSLIGEVTILGPPIVSFVPIIDMDAVTFLNNTIDGISYEWEFGDGEFSTQAQPTHVYLEDGVYEVILTATNNCGTSQFIEFITIATPPIAGIDSDLQEGCAPLTVEFESLASNNTTSWLWMFPGGTPAESTDENPSVIYNVPGVYNVSLLVSNAQGTDEIVLNDYITVIEVPIPDFSFTVNGSVVTFENNSSNSDSYEWDFGDGNTSGLENPIHDFIVADTFTVVLTAISDCGEFEFSQDVIISLLPSAGFTTQNNTFGCSSYEVEFENNSSSNSDSFYWIFEGGTPMNSTEVNPVVLYENAGIFDVTLIATNSLGDDTLAMFNYIEIQTEPTAGYDFITNQLSVDFISTGMFGDFYEWDFGDGNISNSENPTHVFDSQGDYEVELTINNACGSASYSEVVSVYSIVSSSFISSSTNICIPEAVDYISNSINATDYNWTFEGGTPSTSIEENPTISYNQPGVYSVTLIASNPISEDTVTILNYINVGISPTADFSYSGSNALVQFNNLSEYGESYYWDFGDGESSTEENPQHQYPDEGTYITTLTVTNSCGESTINLEVNTNIAPIANFTSDFQSGCAQFIVNYTDDSQYSVDERLWTFEGGSPATSEDINPEVTYNVAGTYLVTLIVTNQAGSDTLTINEYITVNSKPIANGEMTISDNTVDIVNTSINFDNYYWEFNGEIVENQDFNQLFSNNGNYIVTLNVENECGTSQKEFVVSITAYPTSAISYSHNIICEGDIISFEANSPNADTYNWTFDGGSPQNSDLENPIILYEAAGIYSVSLKITNQFGETVEVVENIIVVEETPKADFESDISSFEVVFNNNSSDATNFEWDFGNGSSSSDENPTVTYTKNGVYTITLIAFNGNCSDTLTKELIIDVLDVEDNFIKSISMYPNPARDIIFINFNGLNKLDRFEIYDITGKLVLVKNNLGEKAMLEIEISDLAEGSYIVRLSSDKLNAYKKLIILD